MNLTAAYGHCIMPWSDRQFCLGLGQVGERYGCDEDVGRVEGRVAEDVAATMDECGDCGRQPDERAGDAQGALLRVIWCWEVSWGVRNFLRCVVPLVDLFAASEEVRPLCQSLTRRKHRPSVDQTLAATGRACLWRYDLIGFLIGVCGLFR